MVNVVLLTLSVLVPLLVHLTPIFPCFPSIESVFLDQIAASAFPECASGQSSAELPAKTTMDVLGNVLAVIPPNDGSRLGLLLLFLLSFH